MNLSDPKDKWIRGLLIKHFFSIDENGVQTSDKPLWAVVNQKHQIISVAKSKSEARRMAIYIVNVEPKLVIDDPDSMGDYICDSNDDWAS